MNWRSLADIHYWLEGFLGDNAPLYAPPISRSSWSFWALLISFGAIALLGAFVQLSKNFLHPRHPLVKRNAVIANNLLVIGLTGIFWFASRMLGFSVLSGRFILLGLILYTIIFSLYLIRYAIVFLPIEYKYYKDTKVQNVI